MEKLTKWHWQIFEPEKLAHKICAKKAQNCAKIIENGKNCTTKASTALKNPKNSTAVKN